MSIPTIKSVTERLDGLERQNIQLRWVAAGLSFVAVLVFVEARAGSSRQSGTIEAEKLVLKDKEGRVRARLGVDGVEPTLVMFDSRGRQQINLGIAGNDFSSLTFSNSGQTRMLLQSKGDGNASFRIFDRDEKSTASWFMTPKGATGLSFANDQHGIAMGIDREGQSAIVSTDEHGRENGRLGATTVTSESLGLIKGPLVTRTATTEVACPSGESAGPPNPMPMPITKTDEKSGCDLQSSARGVSN